MDVSMPGIGGLDATSAIVREGRRARVLALTQYADREYVYRMLRAGAAGYVLKSTTSDLLCSAIRAVASGGSYLDPLIAPAVIEGYVGRGTAGEASAGYESLTDREKQVLKHIAEGASSKDVARVLDISVKTVLGHRTNLMQKLGLHNRADLVRFAVRHGLVEA
jgi:DNA-binding NarL/FixJ family response regulator